MTPEQREDAITALNKHLHGYPGHKEVFDKLIADYRSCIAMNLKMETVIHNLVKDLEKLTARP